MDGLLESAQLVSKQAKHLVGKVDDPESNLDLLQVSSFFSMAIRSEFGILVLVAFNAGVICLAHSICMYLCLLLLSSGSAAYQLVNYQFLYDY